jgi:hypothetical protein
MFQATVHHGADYLMVEASGFATLADLCGYMDLVGTIAGKRNYRRAVLNLLEVEIELGFTEHLQLGAHAAQSLRNLRQVASVVPERYRTGTSEKAAQKSGLQLRAFTSLQEGVVWVLGPPESGG